MVNGKQVIPRARGSALARARGIPKEVGFTVIELLVVVVLLGTIAALAAPSFKRTILSQRVRTTSDDIYASLLMARSEAMKRNMPVNVIPAGSVWTAGWSIQTTSSGTTYTIQKQDALNSNISVSGPSSSGVAATVTFNGTGRPATASAGSTFTVFASADSSVAARCVGLSLNGMPSTSKDTDGNSSNGCQ